MLHIHVLEQFGSDLTTCHCTVQTRLTNTHSKGFLKVTNYSETGSTLYQLLHITTFVFISLFSIVLT